MKKKYDNFTFLSLVSREKNESAQGGEEKTSEQTSSEKAAKGGEKAIEGDASKAEAATGEDIADGSARAQLISPSTASES